MLTPKQKAFCEEYLIDLNATQAAIRAGYSQKTAKEQAARMLSNVNLQTYIQELKNKRSERVKVSTDEVLNELKLIGFSDITDYFEDGSYTLADLKALKAKARAIQSIQIDSNTSNGITYSTVKFKLHDKLSALEKIAKHIGFFEKDNGQRTPEVQNNITTGLTFDQLYELKYGKKPST